MRVFSFVNICYNLLIFYNFFQHIYGKNYSFEKFWTYFAKLSMIKFLGVMNVKKVLLLVSCILMLCTVTVFGFTDVDENSDYYEAINYMYENGIVVGYGDDIFKPDNPISYNELVVILTRFSDNYDKFKKVFDLPHPHWATSYLIFARTEGWLNASEMYYGNAEECMQPIPKSVALRAIVGLNGLELYNYRFYEKNIADIDDCISEDVQNAVMYAYVTGLIDIDENNNVGVNDNITRAEVCKLLYDLRKLKEANELKVIVPEMIQDLDIVFIEEISDKGRLFVINELTWFPVDVIKEFNARGWTLYITNNSLLQSYTGSYFPELRSAVGLCDYNGKEIWVSYTLLMNIQSTLMHEFGHFVEGAYCNKPTDKSVLRKLYNEEQKGISEFSKNDYCETNTTEFFAEAFKAYTAYAYYLDIPERDESYQKLAPKTYEYFTELFMKIDDGFKAKVENKAIEEEINNSMGDAEEKSNDGIKENNSKVS